MGELVQLKQKSNVVMDWLDQFSSEKTIETYKCSVEGFFGCRVEDVNDWKIKSVKVKDVQGYIKGMFNDGKSDNTVETRKASLSSLFEYCIDEKIISENVWIDRRIKKLIKVNSKKGEEVGIALSKDEIGDLLDRIDNIYERLLIGIMIKTGVRVSEVIKIKYEDIIKKNNCYWLRVEGKGRKIRFIPIKEKLLKKIEEYIDFYDAEERLFEIGVRQVNRIIKKWDDKLTPHDLRRTFITNLIKNGASINVVQELAGHDSMATTQKYFKEYERFNEKTVDYIDW